MGNLGSKSKKSKAKASSKSEPKSTTTPAPTKASSASKSTKSKQSKKTDAYDTTQDVSTASSSSSSSGGSKELDISKDLHRYIVGTKGATIQKIQSETGAKITVPDSSSSSSIVTISGTASAIKQAEKAINDIVSEQGSKKKKRDEIPDGEAVAAETDKLYAKYQKEVDEHAKKRSELFDQASKEYESGNKAKAAELRDLAKAEGELMEKAQKKASREIFKAKNAKLDKFTVDLHGLHVEDALELLQERMNEIKKGETLCIIYGAGNHSDKRGPLIKPAVQKLLGEKGLQYSEVNNGSVNVTM